MEISPDLLFLYLRLWYLSFSKKSHAWITMVNLCSWNLCNTHNHAWLFIERFYFFYWSGRILRKVESLMMILLSGSISSFSPPYYGGIKMLLYSSLIETYNNNFGTIFFLFIINGYVSTIICYWIFHKLRMVYNPFLNAFFELLIHSFMTTYLINSLQQRIYFYGCLVFLFGRNKPADGSLVSEIQCFKKLAE